MCQKTVYLLINRGFTKICNFKANKITHKRIGFKIHLIYMKEVGEKICDAYMRLAWCKYRTEFKKENT